MIFASSIGLTSEISAFEVGEQIEPFTLKRWEKDIVFDLADHPQGIVVLDFFAYWCIPCIKTSTELEQAIQKHYQRLGGNPAGLPVQVLSINVESRMPQKTNSFIMRTGASLVLDDPGGELLEKLDGKAMPFVVVLHGQQNPTGTDWEIVYKNSGYEGTESLRNLIDNLKSDRSEIAPVLTIETPPENEEEEFQDSVTAEVSDSQLAKQETVDVQVSSNRQTKRAPELNSTSDTKTTIPTVPPASIPDKGISYTAGINFLGSNDIYLATTYLQRRKTYSTREWDLNLSYGNIDIDYEPVSEADVIGKSNKLKEGNVSTQLAYSSNLSPVFEMQAGGGAYKGFTDHRSLWLDEYYKQQFFGLDGYKMADPWGFNLTTGLSRDTQSGIGLISATLIFAQDDVAPGYDRPIFQDLDRGRQRLHTGSIQLQQESVLTRTSRIQNQVQMTRTTDREVRYLYSGYFNQAIGENWVLRAEGAYTFESVEEEEESDFESHSFGVTLEYDWDQRWFLSINGRIYEDNGEIETSILISAGPPPLETEHIGLTFRRQNENSSWRLSIAAYSSTFGEVETTIRPFGNLYQNRDWLLASGSYNFQF